MRFWKFFLVKLIKDFFDCSYVTEKDLRDAFRMGVQDKGTIPLRSFYTPIIQLAYCLGHDGFELGSLGKFCRKEDFPAIPYAYMFNERGVLADPYTNQKGVLTFDAIEVDKGWVLPVGIYDNLEGEVNWYNVF